MSAKTKIEWCDATWNPVQGCDPISPGCKNCYARQFAERFRGTPNHPYEYGFDLKFFPERLNIPSKWKKPKNIFVCSMSDLFHKDIDSDYIYKVFLEMVNNQRHIFFVLTKRPERMAEIIDNLRPLWPPHVMDNIWFGVSVEDEHRMWRLEALANIKGINRFVSFEPLIGRIFVNGWRFYLSQMDWIICGAETGYWARVIPDSTVFNLKDFANEKHIPFFFKKWGTGLDNGAMPRQFPVFRKVADNRAQNNACDYDNTLKTNSEDLAQNVADGKENVL